MVWARASVKHKRLISIKRHRFMKVAMMCYHSNIYALYPEKWIESYRKSIEEQEYKQFDIHEVNYGEKFGMVFFNSIFQSKKFPTFVHCMNWLLDELFANGYDYVMNSNVDDVYEPGWIKKTLSVAQRGYDIVSCNFKLFNEEEIYKTHYFDKLSIDEELRRNHNILCHPAICYSKTFWEKGFRYEPEEIPFEDMMLWKRAVSSGAKIFIQPEHHVLHRVHDNSVCKSNNR
jgi:hypothetical protein